VVAGIATFMVARRHSLILTFRTIRVKQACMHHALGRKPGCQAVYPPAAWLPHSRFAIRRKLRMTGWTWTTNRVFI
jgi:hypothetical protein